MPILSRDIETQSAANLKKVGPRRYAADPTTRVLCIGYAVDDGPLEGFVPEDGKPAPDVFIEAERNPDWSVAAHNDAFESAIEEYILSPRYACPLVPIERHICTMAMARYHGLPGALGKVAALLDLPIQKDRDGARLMLELCRPRKPHPDEDPTQIYWPEITPEKLARLIAYCKNDVAVEREIYRRLPRLPEDEHRAWCLDRKINVRGFRGDLGLAHSAGKLVQAEKAHINSQIRTVTAGAVAGFTKLNDMRDFINARGHHMSKVNKRAVSAVLAHDPDDTVREVLQLRQASSNTAVEKYNAVLASAFPDQRIYGLLNYYGTHTGRWTSAGFNIHNLPREDSDDALAAITAIQSGDLERVRSFGPPLDVIARVARGLVVAPEGKLLMAGDFSIIEPRVGSWVSEEQWKLDTFRKFDATGDPMLDAHRVVGARMRGCAVDPDDEEMRQHGKTVHMALNYGGSVPVWRKFVPDDPRSDEQIKAQEIDKFRQLHPAQTRFMFNLDSQALQCVRYRAPVQHKRHSFEMDGDTLILRLPSGRPLFYRRAHIRPGRFGKDVVAYHNPAKNCEDEMWYGAWFAHLVSATSRDLLVNALFNLDAADFKIVLHVHDESVAEIDPTDIEHSRERFKKCMLQAPAWADGLPLAAKVRVGPRYIKTDAPAQTTPIQLQVGFSGVAEISNETKERTSGLPIGPLSEHNLVDAEDDAHADHHVELHVCGPIAAQPPPPSAEPKRGNGSCNDFADETMVDGKIRCPFHDDRKPSCQLYADGHYHCFGCGAHGSIEEDLDISDAMLDELVTNEPKNATGDIEYALKFWDEAQPITNTLAARYLAETRKLDLAVLPTDIDAALRFHPRCTFTNTRHPCLLALYRDVELDTPAGIIRIALTPEAKKIERRTLGKWPGVRTVKLWSAANELVIGEGIESVLGALCCGAAAPPAWAMGPKNDIERFPILSGVKTLTILVDKDLLAPAIAEACATRWVAAGRTVRMLTTNHVKDFNDLIMS